MIGPLRGAPGRRFRALHRVRRGRHPVLKSLTIGAGLLFMLLGVLLIPTPGPGALAVLFGAGLVASESLTFARALDRLELRVRALFS
jgi:O-antigen/teichoic acid export membrane protein